MDEDKKSKTKSLFTSMNKSEKVEEETKASNEDEKVQEELQREGWQAILDNFKKYVEEN